MSGFQSANNQSKTESQASDLSAAEQQAVLWTEVLEHNSQTTSSNIEERHWPTYKTIMADIASSDYTQVLECPHDKVDKARNTSSPPVKKSGKKGSKDSSKKKVPSFCKALCAHGVVCCVRMVLFPNPPDTETYTGLFAPDQIVEHCILRLSSAAKPPTNEISTGIGRLILGAVGGKLRDANLFPCVALKAFRGNGVRSGNLLFSGAKIGQPETDFFAHSLCTQVTERVSKSLKPIIRKFYDYSDNPLSLGVSDFCSFGQEGEKETEIQFPYVVLLNPVYNLAKNETDINGTESCNLFDSFLTDLMSIPNGSTLYNIFVCPDPLSVLDPTKLQKIGKIVSTSEMIPSGPDDGLFFRHQKKEEDFELRPEWKEEVKAQCSPDGGKTKDSISKLAGSKLLEIQINQGKYMDYERLAASK